MNRVKELRKEKGLTQRKLSMDLHVSQQYISKVENGESSLTEDIILRMAKYFHVSVAYLLGACEDRFSELPEEWKDPSIKEWMEKYYLLNKTNQQIIKQMGNYLVEIQKDDSK